MRTFITESWHYITGLAGIGSVSALCATGTISGAEALPIITGITTALVGGGLVAKGTTSSTTPTP